MLQTNGHEVSWFKRSSSEISNSITGAIKAFFTGIYNPLTAKTLDNILEKTNPDIVQVQNIYPLISVSIFKPIKKRRIPVVMRCPNYRLFCPNGLHLSKGRICEKCTGNGKELWCILKNCENNIFKSTGYALRNAYARITKKIINNVDMFIVQTEFQKNKFIERGITTERIGILSGIVPECESQESEHGDQVSFIGRINPEKGIEDFLNAAKKLRDIPFSVAGMNNNMSGIYKNSPQNVKWLGFLESEELINLYRRSRIIVIPSRWYEGFPNVAAQAMAYARPIVAARIGALSSMIEDHKNGLLFETGNVKELAEKIQYLWNQPELCSIMGQQARQKALREYSPEKCYNALIDIYKKAIINSKNNV